MCKNVLPQLISLFSKPKYKNFTSKVPLFKLTEIFKGGQQYVPPLFYFFATIVPPKSDIFCCQWMILNLIKWHTEDLQMLFSFILIVYSRRWTLLSFHWHFDIIYHITNIQFNSHLSYLIDLLLIFMACLHVKETKFDQPTYLRIKINFKKNVLLLWGPLKSQLKPFWHQYSIHWQRSLSVASSKVLVTFLMFPPLIYIENLTFIKHHNYEMKVVVSVTCSLHTRFWKHQVWFQILFLLIHLFSPSLFKISIMTWQGNILKSFILESAYMQLYIHLTKEY